MVPPRAGQCAVVIDGAHTELLIAEYADRVLVVATQIGKLGTVFQLSRGRPLELGDLAFEDDGATDAATASVDAVVARVVIGRRDDDALRACARRIADALFAEGLEKCVRVARRGDAATTGRDDDGARARLTRARRAGRSCARSGCGRTRAWRRSERWRASPSNAVASCWRRRAPRRRGAGSISARVVCNT